MIHLFGKYYLHFRFDLQRSSYRKWERRRWEWIWHQMDKMQAFEQVKTVKVWNHKVYQPIYFVFMLSIWKQTHDLPYYEHDGPVNLDPKYFWLK